MNRINQRYISVGVIVAVGLAAGFLLYYVTQLWGIGVSYDAHYYVSSASNFLNNLGFGTFASDGSIKPLVKFPPFYPMILIAVSWITGLDTVIAARWVGIGLYAMSVSLIGWLIFVYSRSIVASALGAMIVLSNPFWLKSYHKAMSEPPYIVLMLLMLYMLSEYGATKRTKFLILTGLLSGLGLLTRYIGGSLVAFGGISLLLFSYETVKDKIKNFLTFAFVAGLVIGPWLFQNLFLSGSMLNRNFAYHPPPWEKFSAELPNIFNWLLPITISQIYEAFLFIIFLIGLVIVIIIWFCNLRRGNYEKNNNKDSFRFVTIIFGYILIYLLLLYISMSFFDASTPFNGRILSPIYALFVILSILVVWNGVEMINLKVVKIGALMMGLMILGFNMQFSVELLPMTRLKGLGFTGQSWQSSETIEVIKQLDSQVLIYTNEQMPVFFLTGRFTLDVPEKLQQLDNRVISHYSLSIEEMHQYIKQERGILVIFLTIRLHSESHTVAELSEGLILWKILEDGLIYVHPDSLPDFVEASSVDN